MDSKKHTCHNIPIEIEFACEKMYDTPILLNKVMGHDLFHTALLFWFKG